MHRTEELAEESTPSETKKENPQYFYVSQGHVQLEEEIVSQSTEGKIPNQEAAREAARENHWTECKAQKRVAD